MNAKKVVKPCLIKGKNGYFGKDKGHSKSLVVKMKFSHVSVYM